MVRWRIAPGQSFLWDDYGSEAVLFDSASGCTHILTPAAAEALLAMEAAAGEFMTLPQIRAAVLEALDVDAGELSELQVLQLLGHLARLGFVDTGGVPVAGI